MICDVFRMAAMQPKQTYYFRAWRKHRGLTQEDLGAAVGLTASSISQLETGKQGFTDSTLAKIASELRCRPGDLLMWPPEERDAFHADERMRRVFNKLAQAPEAEREMLLRFLESSLDQDTRSRETATMP